MPKGVRKKKERKSKQVNMKALTFPIENVVKYRKKVLQAAPKNIDEHIFDISEQ